MRKIEVTAKTVDHAIEKGLQMLGATMEQIDMVVLEKPSMLKRAKIEITFYETEEEREQAKVSKVEASTVITKIKKAKPIIRDKKVREDLTDIEKEVITNLTVFLQDLINVLDVQGEITHKVLGDDIYMIMTGKRLGVLIGHHGTTLEALQNLINGITKNKFENYKKKVFLDIENYRQKRIITLQSLAKRMATRVVKSQRNVKLEPMNSFERRIIHSTLQEIPNISTHSEGVDPRRYLVITYKP